MPLRAGFELPLREGYDLLAVRTAPSSYAQDLQQLRHLTALQLGYSAKGLLQTGCLKESHGKWVVLTGCSAFSQSDRTNCDFQKTFMCMSGLQELQRCTYLWAAVLIIGPGTLDNISPGFTEAWQADSTATGAVTCCHTQCVKTGTAPTDPWLTEAIHISRHDDFAAAASVRLAHVCHVGSDF